MTNAETASWLCICDKLNIGNLSEKLWTNEGRICELDEALGILHAHEKAKVRKSMTIQKLGEMLGV